MISRISAQAAAAAGIGQDAVRKSMRRKRAILHMGAPKTGSTCLQAFFSLHAGSLREAGVDYPGCESSHVVTSGAAVGNVVSMLHRAGLIRQAPNSIAAAPLGELWTPGCTDYLAAAVRRSACDTVLFSGEGMSLLPQAVMVDLIERLSRDCDPECILFVRDPFDAFYSAWRQLVKTGRFVGALEELAACYLHGRGRPGPRFGMFNACEIFFSAGIRCKIVNYDSCRNDLAGAFLKAAGIEAAVDTSRDDAAETIYNRSLSPSEALLLSMVNTVFEGSHLPAFFRYSLLGRTDYAPPAGTYYNREIDALILDRYRDIIGKINAVIIGDGLRSCLRDVQTGEVRIQAQDMVILIETLRRAIARQARRVPLLQKLKHAVMAGLLRTVPQDFDPEAYLFMNRDVAAAGLNPYVHYARHGCREGRPYRYY